MAEQRGPPQTRLSEIDHTITNGIPVFIQAITNMPLVRSAVSSLGGTTSRLKFEKLVDDYQKQALNALLRVDPVLAEEFEIDK